MVHVYGWTLTNPFTNECCFSGDVSSFEQSVQLRCTRNLLVIIKSFLLFDDIINPILCQFSFGENVKDFIWRFRLHPSLPSWRRHLVAWQIGYIGWYLIGWIGVSKLGVGRCKSWRSPSGLWLEYKHTSIASFNAKEGTRSFRLASRVNSSHIWNITVCNKYDDERV